MKIPKNWTFKDTEVAKHFSDHVREQLPWYDLCTLMVCHFGRHFLPEHGRMYDIGASVGNITNSLRQEIVSRKVEAISIDNSQEMVDLWKGEGDIHIADAQHYQYEPYDFGVCFLVLMFLPPADQELLLEKLYNNLRKGGALVIVDRSQAVGGYVGTVMHRFTLVNKLSAGASPADIMTKELSLAGVQRPLPPDLLLPYSPTEIFRVSDFAAWVITK